MHSIHTHTHTQIFCCICGDVVGYFSGEQDLKGCASFNIPLWFCSLLWCICRARKQPYKLEKVRVKSLMHAVSLAGFAYLKHIHVNPSKRSASLCAFSSHCVMQLKLSYVIKKWTLSYSIEEL